MAALRAIALIATGRDETVALDLDAADAVSIVLRGEQLFEWVRRHEVSESIRWVLPSAREVYPRLLRAGITLQRSHDLRLCHAILRDTARVARPLRASDWWSRPVEPEPAQGLFDLESVVTIDAVAETRAEYLRQQDVLASASDQRLPMLCAAESAGGLIAEELHAAGVPWSPAEHERILQEELGERSPAGGVPAGMRSLAAQIRAALGDPEVNIDSPPKLLRALHRVGVDAESTSRWLLSEYDHPVIEPLLRYKKMSRLYAANGWAWLAEWVHEGRFRPVYITGGVVTGRWASAGGGALQLPRQLRSAVRADPGWTLIGADVAQLEPRMLAAMASDFDMARAGRGADLYAGVVASGAVATREEAKFAVLGAMYGATTGDSGRLVPKLRKVFPRAMALVDAAARTGEEGGVVSTWLGRTSPEPSHAWARAQQEASDVDAAPTAAKLARQRGRDRGRFTRNFVVQGTAAEWALVWLAEIRHRLWQLPEARTPAPASGPLARRAHLAFFLHDEVLVHAPEELAAQAAQAVQEAAAVATRRLFGDFPIDVPLDLKISESAQK